MRSPLHGQCAQPCGLWALVHQPWCAGYPSRSLGVGSWGYIGTGFRLGGVA